MGSDEEREQRKEQGVDALRADPEQRARESDPLEPEEQHGRIPKSRIGRSARLGTAVGTQATRYAGTAAANVVRSDEKSQERLETRHLETALKMASVLGQMKGAAMKIGQMASFIDVDFLPPEYREIYQEQLSKLRTHAPAMPWE
jgi:predicted unusual protein kinase regulating ubiquinone biosynthesis (AarF/ABC1/UbiB family)